MLNKSSIVAYLNRPVKVFSLSIMHKQIFLLTGLNHVTFIEK